MSDLQGQQEIITPEQRQIRTLANEVEMLTNAGVIECMVRNKAVAERIAELEAEVVALRAWPSRYWQVTKNLDADSLADYDDELASDVRQFRDEAHKVVFGISAKEQQ